MIWKPHNYQLTALSFLLANPKSGLFLDPGLGKTSISLSAIRLLRDSGQSKGVLLVAPLKVCQLTWPNEIIKWDNFCSLKSTTLHGKGKSTLWKPFDIYLINPEGLPWLVRELLDGLVNGKDCPFDTLWIDESTKFKNHKSKTRFEVISKMLPLFKRRHIMTGTPAPRSYIDLWSQVFILDQGKSLFRNYYRFRGKYFYKPFDEAYSYNLKKDADTTIQKAIAPLILDMAQKDHLDIPDVTYNNIRVVLPAKALNHYKEVEQKFFTELDQGTISAGASAQASMKCHQISNGIAYEDIPEDLTPEEEKQFRKTRKSLFVHDAKIQALQELIDELNGKPLLVAYHYKHDLAALKKSFGTSTPTIGSSTSEDELRQIERDWNAGKLPLLFGQPQSMGHGLNLQATCKNVCWYSLTWNLEDYIQFNKRVHRQGVSGKVIIHHLISYQTVDEAMLLRLGDKAKSQQDLREAIKRYRTKITSRNRE